MGFRVRDLGLRNLRFGVSGFRGFGAGELRGVRLRVQGFRVQGLGVRLRVYLEVHET